MKTFFTSASVKTLM